jgi:hypothetical protein
MSEELNYDLVQETTTKLVAKPGYILVRANTGLCPCEEVHIGYNYYDTNVPLATRQMSKPEDWKAIPKPEGWDEGKFDPNNLIDQVNVLKRTKELFVERSNAIDTIKMTNRQANEMRYSYPIWAVGFSEAEKARLKALGHRIYEEGDTIEVEEGKPNPRMVFDDELWEVIQTHTIYAQYVPSVSTLALYRRVHEQEGTFDDPVPYKQGMMAWAGQYYQEGDVVYKCIRDYDGSTAHLPSVLHGYFEVATGEVTDEPSAEQGTLENPITWSGSGVLLNGKYYKDGDVIYLCNRDSGNEVTYPLSALVGLYVEKV